MCCELTGFSFIFISFSTASQILTAISQSIQTGFILSFVHALVVGSPACLDYRLPCTEATICQLTVFQNNLKTMFWQSV